METMANKLSYLLETKRLMREAINRKGVTVAESDTFRTYVNKINAIPTGGGYKSELDSLSWKRVGELKSVASAKSFYDVFKGQEKELTVNGQNCTARLVSDNYNGAEGLVFYVMGMATKYAPFSGSNTSGGFGGSSLKNTLNSTFYNSLSDELKGAIKTVSVPYGQGGSYQNTSVSHTSVKLFIPSLNELKGNANYADSGGNTKSWNIGEGAQFKYFEANPNAVAPSSRIVTRTVPENQRYCFVEANSTSVGVVWYTTANTVNFCFVV